MPTCLPEAARQIDDLCDQFETGLEGGPFRAAGHRRFLAARLWKTVVQIAGPAALEGIADSRFEIPAKLGLSDTLNLEDYFVRFPGCRADDCRGLSNRGVRHLGEFRFLRERGHLADADGDLVGIQSGLVSGHCRDAANRPASQKHDPRVVPATGRLRNPRRAGAWRDGRGVPGVRSRDGPHRGHQGADGRPHRAAKKPSNAFAGKSACSPT